MRKTLVASLLVCAIVFLAACTSTNTKVKKTGLFNDDVTMLNAAYDQVSPNITTVDDLRGLGFQFPGKNVEVVYGPEVFQKISGGQTQVVFKDSADVEKLVEALSRYTLVAFPYQDVVTVSDRIYLNEKNTDITGINNDVAFLIKDGIVIAKFSKNMTLDEHESHYAVLEGVLSGGGVFRSLGSLGSVSDIHNRVVGK